MFKNVLIILRRRLFVSGSAAALWKETAILVTVDEGGGFYDSGFIQPVDFFGTGPHSNDRRVALLDWRSYQPRL
jgi:hypothetical protein